MELTPFVTQENGKPPQRYHNSIKKVKKQQAKSRKRKAFAGAGPMLVKIGICAAACLLVFAMQSIDTPFTKGVVEDVKAVINQETDMDEMLGKLQFVELPNVLEVFSGSDDKLAAPVSAPNVSLIGNEQMAKWEGAPNAEVLASAAGEVRAVGEDPVLGVYVRLAHENDLETIYYGLADVRVEEGQPIRRLDTLGTLGEEGTLCLSVLLSGRPQAPSEYLDLVFHA